MGQPLVAREETGSTMDADALEGWRQNDKFILNLQIKIKICSWKIIFAAEISSCFKFIFYFALGGDFFENAERGNEDSWKHFLAKDYEGTGLQVDSKFNL